MSFQAYIDNIQTKTGLLPADFRALAEAHGFIVDGKLVVKATIITDWLKAEFELGLATAWQFIPPLKELKLK